eukprot:s5851_g4.t1
MVDEVDTYKRWWFEQFCEDERLQEAAESLEIGLRAIELAEEIARNIWRDLHEPHVHSPLVHAGTCEQEDTSERPMPSQWLRDAYAEIHQAKLAELSSSSVSTEQVAASVAHAATAATQLGEAFEGQFSEEIILEPKPTYSILQFKTIRILFQWRPVAMPAPSTKDTWVGERPGGAELPFAAQMALLRNSTPSCERRRLRASGLAIAGKAETLPPRARRNRWGSVKAMTSDGPARIGRHDRMSRRSPWVEADQEVRPRGDLACRTSAFSTPRDLGGHESIVLSADIECSDEESVQEARGRIAEEQLPHHYSKSGVAVPEGKGEKKTLEVDVVVGADGANSRVAKDIEAGDYEYAIAFQERMRIPDGKMDYYKDRAEMYVGDDVSPDFYAWVFPKCDHVAVGTGTVVDKKGIQQYQQGIRDRAAVRIEGGEIIRVEAHPIPEHPRPWRVKDRAILVGDAAGYVTKCSGEGIYFAAKSGRMCAETIAKSSKQGVRMIDEADLMEHIREWDSKYGPTYLVLDLLQKVFYTSDAARESFVELCEEEYVQKVTFDSYLYKTVQGNDPMGDLKLGWKTLSSLYKNNNSEPDKMRTLA